MDAAAEIRTARERAGLTQTQLARRAGTSQATLSAYESGARTPSLDTLTRLLAAAGCRLEVRRGTPDVVPPSASQATRSAQALAEVLALAAELPVRHEPGIGFPRLPRRTEPAR